MPNFLKESSLGIQSNLRYKKTLLLKIVKIERPLVVLELSPTEAIPSSCDCKPAVVE